MMKSTGTGRLCVAGMGAARLAIAVCLTATFVWAEDAGWPMWRYDAARDGQSPHALAEELHLHWTRELPLPRRAWPEQIDDFGKLDFDVSYEPVSAGGLLFVPSMVTDSVTAYDLDRGETRWQFVADGPVRLAPAYADGILYVASDDGVLYALDAATGGVRWAFRAAPSSRLVLGNQRLISVWPVRGAPVVADGVVYAAAGVWPFEGVYVVALDAKTGQVQWVHSGVGEYSSDSYSDGARSISTMAPQGYLAVDGHRLIVSGGRTTPGVFERHTGELLEFDRVDKRRGGFAVSASAPRYLLPVDRCVIRAGDQEYDSREWAEKIGEEVWRLLAADGRLVVVTRAGGIQVFGPEERDPVHHAMEAIALQDVADEWAQRMDAVLGQDIVPAGYALQFGIGSGRMLDEVLARTDYHVVAFDPDPDTVRRMRERYLRAGLYGKRVSVREGDAASFRLPPYIADLVFSEDPDSAGLTGSPAIIETLFQAVRPYGAQLLIAGEDDAVAAARRASPAIEIAGGVLDVTHGLARFLRPDGVPGADDWTHQYANAANTAYSDDDRVRAPLGLTWYGNVSNEKTLPRHMFGPVPQISRGRLVILGVDHISARCVYTGREIWAAELPGVGHFFTSLQHEDQYRPGRAVYFPSHHGSNFVGSPYVSTADSVYVLHDDRCLRLDLGTGEVLAVFRMPDREKLQAAVRADEPSYAARVTVPSDRRWGFLSVADGMLVAGAYPHIYQERPEDPAGATPRGDGHIIVERDVPWHWNATSSEYLVAMDARSGEVRWAQQARHGFRHNAIVSAAGRTFAIDHISEEIWSWLQRRGVEPEVQPEVRAFDLRTGRTLWTYTDQVFGTWLSYSAPHDVLIQTGRPGGRQTLPDEPTSGIVALRGADGAELWRLDQGFGRGPITIHEAQGVLLPGGFDLLTGEQRAIEDPDTGDDRASGFLANKRCGTQIYSRHLATFRSSMASYHDLSEGSGTINLAGVRAGCTNNMIAAGGVLNLPDYTRTCSCAYQLQTSAALVHMPEVEIWGTLRRADPDLAEIERIGINFGAPGGRRDESGLYWVPVPRPDAPVPSVPVRISAGPAAAVRIISALSGDGDADPTLDGDPDTHWSARCGRNGRFRDGWLQYELNDVMPLDRIEMEWQGPEGTKFRIETSLDGEEWMVRGEWTGEGTEEGEPVAYRFDPQPVRHVRVIFTEHEDMSEDRPGRRATQWVRVHHVRIGDLPWPAAYTYFTPKEMFRKHSLLVQPGNSINWVASSGIRDVRYLEIDGLPEQEARYDVTLHFAEPDGLEAGRRAFDVRVQGRTVASAFDIAAAAGRADQGTALHVRGVPAAATMRIELVPTDSSGHAPAISGLQLDRRMDG